MSEDSFLDPDNEKDLQWIVKRRLEKEGYNPVEQKTVYVEGKVCTGDLYIAESDVVIELKSEAGSLRKGLGQCISYGAAGHNTALITDSLTALAVSIFRSDIVSNIPLIEVKVVDGVGYFECVANKNAYDNLFWRIDDPTSSEGDEIKDAYNEFSSDVELGY